MIDALLVAIGLGIGWWIAFGWRARVNRSEQPLDRSSEEICRHYFMNLADDEEREEYLERQRMKRHARAPACARHRNEGRTRH